jgi:short-subunit dehydrogenase
MRKSLPFFLAFGSGVALTVMIQQRTYERNALEWTRLRAQRRAQGGPGTAFITGASSGIGETFARELAHRGYNLVLLARREALLRALADELQREHSILAEPLVADLSDPAGLERAAIRVADIPDLDLLVNNAGFGGAGFFADSDPQDDLRMIRVHVEASVRLARAALPGMIERGFGGVINVSSLAALFPAAGNHTYGATKAYLKFFSESLGYELSGKGVRVQALCPGFTYTEMHNQGSGKSRSGFTSLPRILWLNPRDVVAESLQGLREGKAVVIPGRVYRVLVTLLDNPLVRPLARFAQSQGLQRGFLRSG